MTAQEAKEIIRKLENLQMCIRRATPIHILEEYVTCRDLDMAIKALEKQIPKKPDGDFCPSCGNFYITTKYHFFPDCGQALDWR